MISRRTTYWDKGNIARLSLLIILDAVLLDPVLVLVQKGMAPVLNDRTDRPNRPKAFTPIKHTWRNVLRAGGALRTSNGQRLVMPGQAQPGPRQPAPHPPLFCPIDGDLRSCLAYECSVSFRFCFLVPVRCA